MVPTKEGYLAMLEHSFKAQVVECPRESRLGWLADAIFDFTTYDEGMGALLASWAVKVCRAISARGTFEFIKEPENYRWYICMVNMPFFADRLNWGGSIRGAWWEAGRLQSCDLFDSEDQLLDLRFSDEQWFNFIEAVCDFAQPETEKTHDAN